MGLLNARNLSKAKLLLEKNRHKVGDMVGKATEQVDKVSKGKTTGMSAKVEEAARKYSAGAVTHHDGPTGPSPAAAAADTPDVARERPDDAELQRRQAEANIAAANALKAAADAAAGIFGQAATRSVDDATPDSDGSTNDSGESQASTG